jgi:selenocysteine-specific elongation factor
VVAERGWVAGEELTRLLGEAAPADAGVAVGRWVAAPGAVAAVVADLEARVDAAGDLGLDVAALGERERAVLEARAGLVVVAGRARRADAAGDPLAAHPFVAALEAEPFAPPSAEEAGVDRGELRELVRRGLVVEREGHHFAPAAVEAAAAVVARLLAANPDGVTAAQVRDALGTTRKHAIPLLGLLDAGGMTRRRGDLRVPGPRLPAV